MRLLFFNVLSDLKQCGNILRTHTHLTDNKYEKIDYINNKKQPLCCDLKR